MRDSSLTGSLGFALFFQRSLAGGVGLLGLQLGQASGLQSVSFTVFGGNPIGLSLNSQACRFLGTLLFRVLAGDRGLALVIELLGLLPAKRHHARIFGPHCCFARHGDHRLLPRFPV